jgi:trehalose synthase
MNDVGIDARWIVMHGAEEFFEVTKLLHNTLQGDETELTQEQRDIWTRYQQINADLFDPSEFDVVILHDPQPLGMRAILDPDGTKATWFWRCHIDLSTPNPGVIDFLLPHMQGFDAALFHRQEYVPDGLGWQPYIVPPAIDPLAPKNMALSGYDAKYIVGQFGIDVDRPLMCQVSRFDPWKDPLGVIDAYRTVKQQIPDVQLALVGSMAHDDPEGWEYYNLCTEHADGDNDVFILSNLNNVGAVEVNAFQVHSDVLLQKSVKEGFGLTVAEALWKARPMVAGNVGGIKSQIQHGESGYLVNSSEEAAAASLKILEDPEAATVLARAGKEYVRQHFLMPRLLDDWLRMMSETHGA